MSEQTLDITQDFLIRGRDYLEQFPGFELVGRQATLKSLTAILMRKRANNVLLVGSGGVGCSAICIGLQESKQKPDTPFDIVSKRFFWLDSDWLFSSGDHNKISEGFEKTLRTLSRTPNSVLVLDDMRDFIEAARNNGSTHLINALMRSVKKKQFQIIMETRDEDLEAVLKCHSDMQESYTMLDISEPDEGLLLDIVTSAAGNRLQPHHKINISAGAISTAIEVTSKYRVRDLGLSRAQPERSLTLLDRALTSYRLDAHAQDPRLDELQSRVYSLEQKLNAAPDSEVQAELAGLNSEIEQINTAWAERQSQIKAIYAELRDGEEAILSLETDLEEQQAKEQRLLEQQAETGEPNERDSTYKSFAARTSAAGYDSEAATAIKQQITRFQAEVDKNRKAFDSLAAQINNQLELTKEHVLAEFSSISGIPVSKLTQDERAKLLHLDENLGNRVFGQSEAVSKLSNQVRVARAGLQSANKPQAAFMFLGPSGVGKTELAKALTAELFDDERALLRFDMSEYMEKHAVAKLIGAPPGYEGYEAGGILTNEMRRNPRRIILFDEIEKAHADIFNVFLQILDDARLTDNRGLTVSFRDAIILMTTNIGTQHFLNADNFSVAKELALEDLDAQYRPEFLARFNGKRNIVCFNTLDLPVIEMIAARDIGKLNKMVQITSPEISIEISDTALTSMCRDHYKPITGARGITGYIEGVIKPEIAHTVLFNPEAAGVITIDYDEANQTVVLQPPKASGAPQAAAG